MTELAVNVLKQLRSIFPNHSEQLLLSVVNDPARHTGVLTVDTLLVRCVEQILEGGE